MHSPAQTFKIYTRRSNQGEWQLYGEFASQAEFERERAHIQVQGLYVKRGES